MPENSIAAASIAPTRQTAGQVFRYGIATGRCERDPAPDLHGALQPIVGKHMAAALESAGVSALMRAIANDEGQPLTCAALELSALHFQRPGNSRQMEWAELDVFPRLLTGRRSMSQSTLRAALRRMGFTNDEMTPHGFRTMARTVLVERLNVNPDVIEAQLAHGRSGPLGAGYDRAGFRSQRRRMMPLWAGCLRHLRDGRPGAAFTAAKRISKGPGK